jgi:hypothetical protein
MDFIKYFLFIFLISSCKKKEIEPIVLTSNLTNGILVLNEGLFQYNNASLNWISLSDNNVNTEFFEQKANRYLGDTGNDLKKYGNKIYVVVNVSGTIEVLDAISGNSLSQIKMQNGNLNKQPRSLAFFGSKIFVSCFDGYVDVIDTASLQVEKRIKVGLNPDQIIATNTKIIVSNSGGLNAPSMDSTLSIINPISLIEEQKITVGLNPGDLEVLNENLYAISRGNYSSIAANLKKINLNTLEIVTLSVENPIIIKKMHENLLISYGISSSTKLGLFDGVSNLWLNPNFISLNDITTLYNLQYETTNNKIYLFDAKDYTTSGEIFEFDQNGNKIKSFNVGLIPNSLILF